MVTLKMTLINYFNSVKLYFYKYFVTILGKLSILSNYLFNDFEILINYIDLCSEKKNYIDLFESILQSRKHNYSTIFLILILSKFSDQLFVIDWRVKRNMRSHSSWLSTTVRFFNNIRFPTLTSNHGCNSLR